MTSISQKSLINQAKSKKRFSRHEQYLHTEERKKCFNRRYKVTKKERDALEQTFTGRNLFSININFMVNTSNNALARKKYFYLNTHTADHKIRHTGRCKRSFKITKEFGGQCFCTMSKLEKWQYQQKLHKRNTQKLQNTVKAFRFRQTLDSQKEQERIAQQKRLDNELAWRNQEKTDKDKIWSEYLKTRPKMLAFLDDEHYFNLYGCKRE